jgi:hypothetical protein
VVVDGPLLPWIRSVPGDGSAQQDGEHELDFLAEQLTRLRRARAIPVGYVDRPGSAHVLRTLELAVLDDDQINREAVRQGRFRDLVDRMLFSDLEPNQRTGLFASMSTTNARLEARGHRVAFFYACVARPEAPRPALCRIDLPRWAAQDQAMLDLAHQAIYADCRLTGYPYVLARAHELAVVGSDERAQFEAMLEQALLRRGVWASISAKAQLKRWTGGKRR